MRERYVESFNKADHAVYRYVSHQDLIEEHLFDSSFSIRDKSSHIERSNP